MKNIMQTKRLKMVIFIVVVFIGCILLYTNT